MWFLALLFAMVVSVVGALGILLMIHAKDEIDWSEIYDRWDQE